MLKLASLSLAALLALASPSFAECVGPSKFKDAVHVDGVELAKLRKIATGLPEQVDLVLLLKTAPVAIAFVKGCVIGYGVISLAPVPAKPKGESL